MPAPGDEYTCTLDARDVATARRELNEEPSDREAAVQALRQWILAQPHLTLRTDFPSLLRVLRGAKFSQVRAREMLEGMAGFGKLYPDWFRDVNVMSVPVQHILFKNEYCLILPGYDDKGRKVIVYRAGKMNPKETFYKFSDIIHVYLITGEAVFTDEKVQVNGLVFVMDMSGMTMKHMQRFPLSEMQKWHKLWQGNQPGRMKAFHHLYPGTLFETMFALFKPFFKAKYLERFMLHDTMESVYRHIPPRMWPREYLPDDHKGDCAGTSADIIAAMKAQINSPPFVENIREFTSDKYGVDESKRPAKEGPVGHFRKLNID